MIQRYKEVYKIVEATTCDLGDYEIFARACKEDDEDILCEYWSVCMGAVALLEALDFEEALEVAEKMSDIEIFCEPEYFLDYVCDGELVIFNDARSFYTKANLSVPSVIYKTSTGKVVQIFK